MAEQTTNTKDCGFSRLEGVITMALKNEISWKMLDLLLEELTPTLEKSKQVIKILLKELEKLLSISQDQGIEQKTEAFDDQQEDYQSIYDNNTESAENEENL